MEAHERFSSSTVKEVIHIILSHYQKKHIPTSQLFIQIRSKIPNYTKQQFEASTMKTITDKTISNTSSKRKKQRAPIQKNNQSLNGAQDYQDQDITNKLNNLLLKLKIMDAEINSKLEEQYFQNIHLGELSQQINQTVTNIMEGVYKRLESAQSNEQYGSKIINKIFDGKNNKLTGNRIYKFKVLIQSIGWFSYSPLVQIINNIDYFNILNILYILLKNTKLDTFDQICYYTQAKFFIIRQIIKTKIINQDLKQQISHTLQQALRYFGKEDYLLPNFNAKQIIYCLTMDYISQNKRKFIKACLLILMFSVYLQIQPLKQQFKDILIYIYSTQMQQPVIRTLALQILNKYSQIFSKNSDLMVEVNILSLYQDAVQNQLIQKDEITECLLYGNGIQLQLLQAKVQAVQIELYQEKAKQFQKKCKRREEQISKLSCFPFQRSLYDKNSY